MTDPAPRTAELPVAVIPVPPDPAMARLSVIALDPAGHPFCLVQPE